MVAGSSLLARGARGWLTGSFRYVSSTHCRLQPLLQLHKRLMHSQ
jgi:hypothetical protein